LEEFIQNLNTLKAYRNDREILAARVIDKPEHFIFLLSTSFQVDENLSYKAAWILELVCIKKMNLLLPHLDYFIEHLPKVYKNQAVRPMAKICEELTIAFYKKQDPYIQKVLTKNHREQLTVICFDWLIGKQKVAVKAYAMQCLFLLGNEFDWIHQELKSILEKDFSSEQPAFKARSKHILKKI
jgi:hypothetical protein